MIIADTSGLLAFFDDVEIDHVRIDEFVSRQADSLVVSPYVIAELDYLVESRQGVDAELTVLRELAGGGFDLTALTADEFRSCCEVIERYHDQEIGVTDASLVVLAKRHDTRRILTLDRRHFDVLRPLQGGRFQIVP